MPQAIIALVCSLLAVPNPADCSVDNSLRHERVGYVRTGPFDIGSIACTLGGMQWIAANWRLDPATEYPKVQCPTPSLNTQRMPG
jgi:hypothetical protein